MRISGRLLAWSLVSGCLVPVMSAFAAKTYPDIYPFIPMNEDYIHQEVERLSEDSGFVKNLVKMDQMGLFSAQTKKKPWTSTFWPLNKGLIADPYENSAVGYYNPFQVFSWTKNRNDYRNRKDNFHNKIDDLSSEQLEKLAPSEKYDLLLGDKSFDLTNRIWSYMQAWGSMKEYGYLYSLDKVGGQALERAQMMLDNNWQNSDGTPFNFDQALELAIEQRGGLIEHYAQQAVKANPSDSFQASVAAATSKALAERDNFVLKKKNDYMATWEGICHGWSTAAGIIPRPRKSVSFTLPDGRSLKFFPEDIKGLVSMLWANSLIQDGKFVDKNTGKNIGGGILMQGLRCNEKRPKKDQWGRFYDHRPDAFSKKLEPRCVGVHPAIWHMGLVNIIGVQGRSFIVERKIKAAVDNHPMWKYQMEFFNPYTGKYSQDLKKVYMPFSPENDQFAPFRNPKTRFLVGVKAEMVYLDWSRPVREDTNNEEDDSEVSKKMLYDLELDASGNIIGGQWRATEVGKVRHTNARNTNRLHRGNRMKSLNHNQPDFFWVVTKDWKPFFNETSKVWKDGGWKQISPWNDLSSAPPKDWKLAASGAHAFIYNQTHDYGWNQKCKIEHRDTGAVVEVPCEYKINRPQPLTNVVNKLIELSK